MNSFLYTFFVITNTLIPQASIEMDEDITISMPMYAIKGDSVTIKCNAIVDMTKDVFIKIGYYGSPKDKLSLVTFVKRSSSATTKVWNLNKEQVESVNKAIPNVSVTLKKVDCFDSYVYTCYLSHVIGGEDKFDFDKLFVLETKDQVEMYVRDGAIEKYRCNGIHCNACKAIEEIWHLATVGKNVTVTCSQRMPFPYEKGKHNTFKWYHLHPTGNGNFKETEITTGINGTSPMPVNRYPLPSFRDLHTHNCVGGQKSRTSYLNYTPTENNSQVITFKCRHDFKLETSRDGILKSSVETTYKVCLLSYWTAWTPLSQCPQNCRRSMRRECKLGECPGKSEKIESCTGDLCKKGKWSAWTPSSKCTKSCTRSMRRECLEDECPGNSEKSESCTGDLCNTDKWSDWTPWSKCAKNCTRSRRRECLVRKCLDKSKIQESCTGDLCVKDSVADKAKASPKVVPIAVGVVAAIIVSILAVTLWMKFRKRSTNEQTNAKPQPVITDTTTQYDSAEYNDTTKASTTKENTAINKETGSQNKPKTAKDGPKDNNKKKKTKDNTDYSERTEDYYENSEDQRSRKTKTSGNIKSKGQK